MSRKFQCKTIPISWVEHNGRRLDCNPYMSGAIEAKETIDNLSVIKEPLSQLTEGIIKAGRIPRNWVTNSIHGVPFLSSSDILHADLSNLRLIAKAIAKSKPKLLLKKNTTLITRSGSIGRIAYVRSEIDQMACTEDVLRVIPNEAVIKPGYLYTYLRSNYGIPMIISGTYEAVIQHIEPNHMADLPVPRLGGIEDQAHVLVQRAADEMSESSSLMQGASNQLLSEAGLSESQNHLYLQDERRLGWAEMSTDAFSLRALSYDPRSQDIWTSIEKIEHDRLGDVVDRNNFEGHIVFKRIDCDPKYGIMLLGQRNAFHLRPDGRLISTKSIEGLGLKVPVGTSLIPCHGTLGEQELYCRATLVTERTSQNAFSGDFYRCIPLKDKIKPGYLFAFLRTRLAFRLIRSMSTGSKQQYQHPIRMAQMPIPRLKNKIEEEIAKKVDRAIYLRDHSLELEDQARTLVEEAIKTGGS